MLRTTTRAANILKSQYRLTSILYTKDHYWVQKEAKNSTHFKVGLSDYAQDSYGDFVMVEIDRLNQEVIKDDEIGTVESVKSVATIYAPLSGTVHEVNKAICPDSGKPQLINRDPFGKGWILKMVVNDDSEVATLMNEEQYIQYLKEEDLITPDGDPKPSS